MGQKDAPADAAHEAGVSASLLLQPADDAGNNGPAGIGTRTAPDLEAYAPLSRLSILSRMEELASIHREMERQWKLEVSTYERGGSNGDGDGDGGDDRNHANNSRSVVHPNLFPYHDALYPLLDMYYHLSENWFGVRTENYPSPIFTTTERRRIQVGEMVVPGYLPNSAYAVFESLVPRYRASSWRRRNIPERSSDLADLYARTSDGAGDFSFLLDWERCLRDGDEVVRHGTWVSAELAAHNEGSSGTDCVFGPDKLPTDARTRAMILTKIVKHALSDLQKDHRLGQAAMLLMAELRLFDDDAGDVGGGADGGSTDTGADRFARFLAVIASEYVDRCDSRCHARYFDALGWGELDDDELGAADGHAVSPPTHFCNDWKNLIRTLSTCVSNGITFVTEAHAETIAGFVLSEYDGVSSAAAKIDRQYFESGVLGSSDGKSDGSTPNVVSLLKQNLFYHNNTSGLSGAADLADPTGNEHGGHDVGEYIVICVTIGRLNKLPLLGLIHSE